jgi:O-antigen/teichoic acid export membrane protein
MRSTQTASRRLGWGVADQAISSLTNFALSVAVARLVPAADFGAFAVVFTTYLVALNVTRYLAAQPVSIRYGHVDLATWRTATAAALGLSVVLAAAMGVAMIVAGILLGGTLGMAYIAVGITLPGLLTQDCWRFAFFAQGRGDQSFRNDVTWAVILFAGLPVLAAIGQAGMVQIVILWGLAGTAATIVGVFQARTVPDVRQALAWWREHRDIGPAFLGSELAQVGSTQVTLYLVGALGGLAAAGSLRAAQVLLGPVNIATLGVYVSTIPLAARLDRQDPERFFRLCAALSGLLVVFTLAVVAAIGLFPEQIGSTLLGDSWAGASVVLLPVAISVTARMTWFGARLGLAAMEATDLILRWTIIGAVVSLVASIIGVLNGGVVGAAWGLALADIAAFVPWWWEMRARRISRRSVAVSPSESASDGT